MQLRLRRHTSTHISMLPPHAFIGGRGGGEGRALLEGSGSEGPMSAPAVADIPRARTTSTSILRIMILDLLKFESN